jgi:hypothetical protein
MLDLAVTFLKLREALEGETLATLNGYAAAGSQQRQVRRLSREIRSGALDLRTIAGAAEILAHAMAIHDVLAEVDPAVSVDPPGPLRLYRDRLVRHGSLLEPTRADALVTSRTSPARPRTAPTTLAELLPRLRYIDAGLRQRVTFTRLNRADDIELPDEFGLRIAAVPMLGTRRDVRFSCPPKPAGRYYSAAPNRRRISGRLRAALTALDASGAQLGLVPETTCDDFLLRDWRRLCQAVAAPPESKLTFLLIGTGPVTATDAGRCQVAAASDTPTNRAVVLHRRTGEVLLLQDKQRGFSMAQDYLHRSGLHRSLGSQTIDELLPPALR